MKRYLVLAMRRPDCDPAYVQPHKRYLEELRAQGRLALAGPFGEGSPAGGAYLLLAADREEALSLVHRDPAHTSGGWELTVHEWLAQ